MRTIKVVGVIGAGTMGAAIAQKFSQEGFKVILADRAMNFVDKGLRSIDSMLTEGVERKVMTALQAEQVMSNIQGTDNLQSLSLCDVVVEAIFENFEAKTALFREISNIVSEHCIVASNTSSYSITELSNSIKHPQRFVGLHFFYHAAKNRLVEIIPGNQTSTEVIESMREFTIRAGKDPIFCRDKYGFAVNRFFVPWLNESVRLVEEGIAPIETIDEVCMKLFGIGMGPFALMNATGVPVAYHAEKTLEAFGKLYHVADLLKNQAESGKIWTIHETTTNQTPTNQSPANQSAISSEVEKQISDRMLGVVAFVCSQILDEQVATPTDLNRGAKIGLKWRRGPLDLMRKLGKDETQRLVSATAARYAMTAPTSIGENYWHLESVHYKKLHSKVVITMDEPENLNALSVETMQQLAQSFDKANNDPEVKTIFITGSGKSFVAGADIKFFVNNIKSQKINDIQKFTAYGQDVFAKIDNSPKQIVAVLNGLALGGGMELALCADIILALPKAQIAFPETGIGIYPGLGGTQRSARKIGKGLSKYLILTGKMLSAAEAHEIGIVDKIITIDEMFSLFSNENFKVTLPVKNPTERWKKIGAFFDHNALENILRQKYTLDEIAEPEARKLSETLHKKAPIALQLADKLIEEAKGCSSELDHLEEIFNTSDALSGLTSIGKQVQFLGK